MSVKTEIILVPLVAKITLALFILQVDQLHMALSTELGIEGSLAHQTSPAVQLIIPGIVLLQLYH